MTNKQAIERDYFERFSRIYQMPAGRPEYGDKPDVVLKGEGTIGIEITRLYVQSGHSQASEQKQRPLREAVVSQAQKLYRADGGRRIELHIRFNVTHPITSRRMKTLPKQLAKFAKSIDEEDTGRVDCDLLEDMPEIGYVYLNSEEYHDAQWHVAQVHDVAFTPIIVLMDKIREKELKRAEYRPCDTYWLLVIVDWRDPAQEQEIRIDGLKIGSREFERIILYKPFFEHIVQVWP